MLINILLVILAFAGMEAVAWFTHKYIMHGILWNLHKSHHSERKGIFEKNDWFTVFFASIAILLIYEGFEMLDYRLWLGLGITLYGLAYFIFHDIIVHRRVKIIFKPVSRYMKGIIRAHKVHHKTLSKNGAVSFGFLFTKKKYWEEPAANKHSNL